jgi:DNA primase
MPVYTPNSDRDRVLDATDLVGLVSEHVALRPKGREHIGLCPFHDDRSPSFAVVSHKGTPFYKCFACGVGGNAIDFVMNFHKMSFIEALKFLAARAGIELTQRSERPERSSGISKEDLYRANLLALKLYRRLFADPTEGSVAREVVSRRRIAPAMVEAFQLGYAPDRRDGIAAALTRGSQLAKETGREPPPSMDAFVEAGIVRRGDYGQSDLLKHRLVFPICDDLGRPIAFGGRKLREEDEPKYLNSPESPLFHKSRSLYGIHLAKQSIIKSGTAIVTEGYTDVIACHEAGFTNVVATLGTALTRDHARMLRRLCNTVILLFDGDTAGLRAADRGVEVFFQETLDVKVCTLPDEFDPDELLREPEGPAIFRAALDRSIDSLAYLVRRFRAEYVAKEGISGKQQLLEGLLRKLVDLGFSSVAGVRKRYVLASLATLTGFAEREIEAAMPAGRPNRSAEMAREGQRDSANDRFSDDGASPTGEASSDSSSQPISRARREAERHLLALLLANPDASSLVLQVADPERPEGRGRITLPLTEACPPALFLDRSLQSIYRTWHGCAEAGQRPTFQLVLAELAESRAKGLASDLCLFGESLRERDERATLERIRTAFADLEQVERRENARSAAVAPEAFDGEGFNGPFGGGDEPGAVMNSETPPESAFEPPPPTPPATATPASLLARLQAARERGTDATRIPSRSRGVPRGGTN